MAKLCLSYSADAKHIMETLNIQLIFFATDATYFVGKKDLLTRHGKSATEGFIQELGLFHKCCVVFCFSEECCHRKGKLRNDS